MNVFDYAQTLWNHRVKPSLGASGAIMGPVQSREPAAYAHGAVQIPAGSRSVHERVRECYHACVRVQCGQPTEVVTSASNA